MDYKNDVIQDVNLDILIDTIETFTPTPTAKTDRRAFLTKEEIIRERFGLTKKTHTKKRKNKKKK
jgi:hypothetical protein